MIDGPNSVQSRHDAGLRWVLFFQDTNGLLFKVSWMPSLFCFFLFLNCFIFYSCMLGQFYQSVRFIIFQAIPAALGVSAIKQYHVNSLAVPRKAKEAIGGITKLTHKDGT